MGNLRDGCLQLEDRVETTVYKFDHNWSSKNDEFNSREKNVIENEKIRKHASSEEKRLTTFLDKRKVLRSFIEKCMAENILSHVPNSI